MLRVRHPALAIVLLAGLWVGSVAAWAAPPPPSNDEFADRTLIVLAVPAASDRYYRSLRKEILSFQIAYAKSILGKDNVIILGDKKTLRELSKELPEDILLQAPMRDIWMRDFTPVIPTRPILFRYAAAAQGDDQPTADWVQAEFLRFAKRHGLRFRRTSRILDGGNVVDNGRDKAIVTDRFLSDNRLSKAKAIALLQKELGVEQVAILPADPEDHLGHADGMALFIASNTIALTSYGGKFQKTLKHELHKAFPDIQIIELETQFDTEAWDPRFGSAKGVYANATVTDDYIYLPTYGMETDAKAIEQIRAHTDLEIVTVDASQVSQMGGSVRCLTGQMKGKNARKLIEAARKH